MRCLVLLFSAARPAAAMLLRGSRVRADPKAPAKARTSAAARTAAIVSSSSVLPRGPRAVLLADFANPFLAWDADYLAALRPSPGAVARAAALAERSECVARWRAGLGAEEGLLQAARRQRRVEL